MKKALFLLLVTSISYGQALFDKGIKITGGITTDNTATKVVVQSANNVLNTISKVDLQDAFYFASASNFPVTGITDKLYIARDNNILYRFNGTIYVPMSADVSGKEDISNKSSSFTASSTVTYANTKALVDGLATKQNALTNPVTGTGTTNQLSFWSSSNTLSTLSTAIYPSLSELAYLKGVMNPIQAQLDGKLTGTITNTFIPFMNGTVLNNSVLYQNSGTLNQDSNVPLFSSILSGTEIGNIGTPNIFGGSTNDYMIRSINNMRFYTAFSEKIRLVTNGNLLVGITTDNGQGIIQANGNITASPATLDNQVVVKSQLDLKADLASPALTGTPTAPTPTAGSAGTQIANKDYVLANGASKWTQTGNDIKNNNSGKVNIKSTTEDYLINLINGSGIDNVGNFYGGNGGAQFAYFNTFQGVRFILSGISSSAGLIKYNADLSSTYDDRSLVDKGYVNINTPKQLKDFFTDANNTGTAETDLFSYTTDANRLNATGEKLVAVYAGTFNDATASSQIKVVYGGQTIGDTGALTMSVTGAWIVNSSIMRTGATTARAMVSISTPGASTASYTKYTSLTGLTFTGTNILKITGTAGGATGGNDDITASYGNILWQPAAL